MANKEEMVQVSCSLSKSHVFLLPELMKVITTASSTTYSWDSMKVCVESDNHLQNDARVILNLTKSRTSDEELIQGKLHRCCESVCKHSSLSDDTIGHVKITVFASRTLGEFLKTLSEEEEEDIKGTGWLEKVVSNEMFYPCWYDRLRRQSCHMSSKERIQQRIPSSGTSFILNNVDVFPFFRCSESAGEGDPSQKYWTDQFGFNNDSSKRIIMPETNESSNLPFEKSTGTNSNLLNVEMKKNIRSLKERLQMTALPHERNIFSNYYRSDENFLKVLNSRASLNVKCPSILDTIQSPSEEFDVFKKTNKNNSRTIKKAKTSKPVLRNSPKSLNSFVKKRKRILGSYSADHLRDRRAINSGHIDSPSEQDCRDPRWIKSILKKKSKINGIGKNLKEPETKKVIDKIDEEEPKVRQSHSKGLDKSVAGLKKTCFRIEFRGNSFNPLKVLTRNKKAKNKTSPMAKSEAVTDCTSINHENTPMEQKANPNEIKSDLIINDDEEHDRTGRTRKPKPANSDRVANRIKQGEPLKKTNNICKDKVVETDRKLDGQRYTRDKSIQKPIPMKTISNDSDDYNTALKAAAEWENAVGKSTKVTRQKHEQISESIKPGNMNESTPKSQAADKNDISFMELLSIMTDEVKQLGRKLKTKK